MSKTSHINLSKADSVVLGVVLDHYNYIPRKMKSTNIYIIMTEWIVENLIKTTLEYSLLAANINR